MLTAPIAINATVRVVPSRWSMASVVATPAPIANINTVMNSMNLFLPTLVLYPQGVWCSTPGASRLFIGILQVRASYRNEKAVHWGQLFASLMGYAVHMLLAWRWWRRRGKTTLSCSIGSRWSHRSGCKNQLPESYLLLWCEHLI